jgi:hypothetical protein
MGQAKAIAKVRTLGIFFQGLLKNPFGLFVAFKFEQVLAMMGRI